MTCRTSAVAVCCSSAFARLGYEPRVLHRDDRLCREVLQQRDLLVREGANFLAVGHDGSEEGIILDQRDHEMRT